MTLASVIIPVFNQLEFTKDCLESFVQQHDLERLEIIVVDNGSTDGTRAYLQETAKRLQSFRLITLDENQGYAKANNLAAQSA